jgi:small subunit ribosomal protein S17
MAKQMRKVRTGSVVRTTMDQTAIVEMVWKQPHPIYGKGMRRVARFYVHDPQRQCQVGDLVKIQETRPISKTKHWRLLQVLERRQVAGVRPIELETDVPPAVLGTDGGVSAAVASGGSGPAGDVEGTGR